MAKVVYTKDFVDMRTGELVGREITRKRTDNAEQFIRTYVDDIYSLAKCSGAEMAVVLACLRYLEYNTNKFILTTERRYELSKGGDLAIGTVSVSISKLLGKNIFVRMSNSTYLLNPYLFFYGADKERKGVIDDFNSRKKIKSAANK